MDSQRSDICIQLNFQNQGIKQSAGKSKGTSEFLAVLEMVHTNFHQQSRDEKVYLSCSCKLVYTSITVVFSVF